jgi:hypothetical protein
MNNQGIKVYEYFKTDDMVFTGKHKEYIDRLWIQNKIQESYFKRLVDLYAVSAIVGFKIGFRVPEEKDDSGLKRTVQVKQLVDDYQTLSTIMKIILIMDNSRNIPMDKKLDSAFAFPTDEKTYRDNMELFNSYSRGGIEYIYEQLVLRHADIDDAYNDSRISNIVNFINSQIDETALLN